MYEQYEQIKDRSEVRLEERGRLKRTFFWTAAIFEISSGWAMQYSMCDFNLDLMASPRSRSADDAL